MATTNRITLQFHSFAAKAWFIKKNGIATSEIISETPSSITIESGSEGYENSVYVHSWK